MKTIKFLTRVSILILLITFVYLSLTFFDLPYRMFGVLLIGISISLTLSAYAVVSRQGLGVSDPVFILSSFLTLYTVSPVIQTVIGFNFFAINSIYIYSDNEVFIHASRFLLFNFVILIFYFFLIDLTSGKRSILDLNGFNCNKKNLFISDIGALNVAIFFLVLSFICLNAFAGPVETYYDNYTKFDHLSPFARTIVSIFKRLYWGIIPIIVVLTLYNFKNKKSFAIFLIGVICAIDLVVSQGSRINTLIIVIQALVVYNILIQRIRLVKLTFIAFPLIILMALVELLRLTTGDIDFQEMSLVPGELNALFFPSIELYKMRELGSFPPINDLMIFKDIYFATPFLYNNDIDPMHWYWINFHPDAQVAPFTMGPIADSAFFGSWAGIILRGIVLAANIFILRALLLYMKKSWLSLLFFSYAISISILALKYSVLSYQEQILKNLLPTLLLFFITCKIFKLLVREVSQKKMLI